MNEHTFFKNEEILDPIKDCVTLVQIYKERCKWTKKRARNNQISARIKFDKYLKKIVRRYQSTHYGQDPRTGIPDNTFYCYERIEYRPSENPNDPPTLTLKGLCPHWYSVDVSKDRLNHDGVVAVGQNHIGGCKLLGVTDDDMDGWGLLWDQCKECGIKTDLGNKRRKRCLCVKDGF